MQKRTETVEYTYYEHLLEDCKSQSTIKLDKQTSFVYSRLKFSTFNATIKEDGRIDVGCQSPLVSELEECLKYLKGEDLGTECYAVNYNGGKIFKKEDIEEVSDNFYILNNNKVIRKTEVKEFKDFEIKNTTLIYERDAYYKNAYVQCYYWKNGSMICPVTHKDNLIRKVEYLLSLHEALKEAQKDFDNQNK